MEYSRGSSTREYQIFTFSELYKTHHILQKVPSTLGHLQGRTVLYFKINSAINSCLDLAAFHKERELHMHWERD